MTEWPSLPTDNCRGKTLACWISATWFLGLLWNFVFDMSLLVVLFCMIVLAHSFLYPTMSRHPPRPAASRSRSPSSHGPTPYNPPLTLGTIESAEFFTRWRPVILMVNFDALSRLDEARNGGLLNQSREQAAPSLRWEEERAIFTFTKILQTHQLNMLFGTLEAEVLCRPGVSTSPLKKSS